MPAESLLAPSPPPPVPARPYFPELECLRGLAITLVYAFHSEAVLRAAVPGASDAAGTWVWLPLAFVYSGNTGVSLFFVLSAFLLSLPFLAAVRGGPRVSTLEFFRRRALRILPLYWVVVAVAVAFHIWQSSSLVPIGSGLVCMFFLNSFIDIGVGLWPFSVPWWSLATEVQFYLVLPLIGALVGSPRRRRLGLVALLAWAAAYAAFITGDLHARSVAGQILLRSSVFGRSPLFLGGMLAAAIYVWRGEALRVLLSRTSWVAGVGGDLFVLACFVGLGMILQWTTFLGDMPAAGRHTWRFGEAFCWSAIVLALILAPLRARWLLVNPVLERIGIWSYSIFLIHLPVLTTIAVLPARKPDPIVLGPVGNAAAFVGLTVLTIAGAACTHRFIEKPFMARARRGRPAPPSAAGAPLAAR
ncbi:MAG: acyltransferase [Candidatus Binatia bacterium]